jgi:hypothetical protein
MHYVPVAGVQLTRTRLTALLEKLGLGTISQAKECIAGTQLRMEVFHDYIKFRRRLPCRGLNG